MILSDKNDQKQLGRSAQLEDVKYEEDDKRGRMVSMFYGANFLEILSRDATTGHDVRRMLSLAVLDELVVLVQEGVHHQVPCQPGLPQTRHRIINK